MFELAIVGAKNSGKTTLLTALVNRLTSAGLKVATVKHTGHAHTFDTEGKDSFRHREAGAALTMAISSKEMALFGARNETLIEELRALMRRHFDWLLVEGDKSSNRPKVLLTENIESLKADLPCNVIATFGATPLDARTRHFDRDDPNSLLAFLLENIARHQTRGLNESH